MFMLVVRSLLGLLLLVTGVNKFLAFMQPPNLTPDGAAFLQAIEATGYLWELIGGVEVFVGALLLFKRWVPFALVLLAPVSVNILLFHAFLSPELAGAWMGYLVVAANLLLGLLHLDAYRGMFR